MARLTQKIPFTCNGEANDGLHNKTLFLTAHTVAVSLELIIIRNRMMIKIMSYSARSALVTSVLIAISVGLKSALT